MPNETLGTYRIPAKNLASLQDALATLAKRARRLGVEAPTMRVIETEEVQHACLILGHTPCPKDGFIDTTKVVEVTGERPRIAGWRFIATLEHIAPGETLVRTVPGEEAPIEYRTAGPACIHCGQPRLRRDTYLVAHDDDGQVKQVGSSCLKDFLGHADPQRIARWAEVLGAFEETARASEEWGFNGGGSVYETRGYLETVASVIRVKGWRSATTAREQGGEATAWIAHKVYDPLSEEDRKLACQIGPVTDEDKARAARAIEWAEARLWNAEPETLSDYLHNLRVATKAAYVGWKHLGIVASLITTAERDGEQRKREEKQAEEAKVKEWIGTEGKRETFRGLTLRRVTEWNGDFGLTTIHGFVTPEGNDVVWFRSGDTDLETDKTYDVTASVKAHRMGKYGKETVITRAKAKEAS